MFELPEVETVRRDLERDIVGKKIKSAEAMSMEGAEAISNPQFVRLSSGWEQDHRSSAPWVAHHNRARQ